VRPPRQAARSISTGGIVDGALDAVGLTRRHLVYGAPEWTRSPRLPLVGAERDFVIVTVNGAIEGLANTAL
jgi:hypothetical protein